MLCPKLIEGSLGFIQLGQEPRKRERLLCCVWEWHVGPWEGRPLQHEAGRGLGLYAAFPRPLPPLIPGTEVQDSQVGVSLGPNMQEGEAYQKCSCGLVPLGVPDPPCSIMLGHTNTVSWRGWLNELSLVIFKRPRW